MRPFLHVVERVKSPADVEHPFQGLKWHPAFTSKKRISDYVKEPETCLGAAARNLFEMLPDSNFWLNPLSECQKPLPATEIALLMNGRIFEVLKTTR